MSATIYQQSDGIPLIPAGEWAWVVKDKGADPSWLAFGCPCGNHMCGGTIPVSREKTKDPRAWKWDGNWDTPTLSPSIQRRGHDCNWHGFLKKGVFESV